MHEIQGKRQNSAIGKTASIVGAYAGLLGAVHGYFEVLQGDLVPSAIGINAVGTPCQADKVWHACLPAETIVPNFLVTGILAIILSLIGLVWAVVLIERKNGGRVMSLLSFLMLMVGGGNIPTFYGLLAGFAVTRIETPPDFFRTPRFNKTRRFLARIWPFALTAFVVWSLSGWILGHFFNQAMLDLRFVLFFFCNLGLPLLAVFTGFARDVLNSNQAENGNNEAKP
jgi:hypothetical protein